MMVQFDVKRVTKGTESFMVSFDFTKTPITQIADYIIIAANKNKTSDIHFDPRDEGMMVRFRIDGDCQDYTFIPKVYEKNLTTRLKLLANMNITETRLPQDGAIKGEFGGQYMDMRVACLPTNQGEKIVIRILDYTRSLQGIDSLGFHPKNLEKIKHMMGVPNGIILVTGATGSGKSTTTYSMLSALNKPEVNVITVEDPVEMNIEGINQVQVNAEIGMTFAAALRSILREDPNVILIGEIRDSETAQIAVRASITGHLVLSTLHTNSALATVERLLDMDVERYLLSTALTGIISQRLAKQLCPDCRYQRETTPYEKKVFKKFLHKDIAMIWDANPKGCDNCRKGYRGRIAVHEVLELDDHIRNSLNDEKLSKEDFSKMIYNGNTITMLQDALIKALDGLTTFEEVYRTIEIENEDEDNYIQEITEVTEQKEEEEQLVNLPTGDDLLADESGVKSVTPLTQTISIPGITSGPEAQTEEVKEEKKETATIESQNIATANEPLPLIPLDTANQKQETKVETNKTEAIPSTPAIASKQTTAQTEAKQSEPVEQISQTTQTVPTPVASTATVPATPTPEQPTGYKIVMPEENIEKKTEKKQVEPKEPTPAEPIGYKVVMPEEGPVKPVEPKKTETITTELKQEPPVPTTPAEPVKAEYKVSSGGLDYETTVSQQQQQQPLTPQIQEIVKTTAPTPVKQLESPFYMQATNNDSLSPSFDIKTNPTELANRLMQISPTITSENQNNKPLQNIQAVSVLPSVSETTQEKATGSQVLNDPGIRIAETPAPLLPTIDLTPKQEPKPIVIAPTV